SRPWVHWTTRDGYSFGLGVRGLGSGLGFGVELRSGSARRGVGAEQISSRSRAIAALRILRNGIRRDRRTGRCRRALHVLNGDRVRSRAARAPPDDGLARRRADRVAAPADRLGPRLRIAPDSVSAP